MKEHPWPECTETYVYSKMCSEIPREQRPKETVKKQKYHKYVSYYCCGKHNNEQRSFNFFCPCCSLSRSLLAHHCACTAVCSAQVSQYVCVCVCRQQIQIQSLFWGGHWLSSRAQTCCGQPVRPFTFFSPPKDSCRPSVCGGEKSAIIITIIINISCTNPSSCRRLILVQGFLSDQCCVFWTLPSEQIAQKKV